MQAVMTNDGVNLTYINPHDVITCLWNVKLKIVCEMQLVLSVIVAQVNRGYRIRFRRIKTVWQRNVEGWTPFCP